MTDIDVTITLDDAIDVTIDPNAVPPLITQAEAEAGTSTGERVVTAQRIAQAIAALQTLYAAASQTEAEAGTESGLRSWSPLRVAQAIAALESDATPPGGSTTLVQFNDANAFGGMAGVKWTKAIRKLQLGEGAEPILEEHHGKVYQIMQDCGNQTGTYAVDCAEYNDSIVTATGNLVLQMMGHVAGMGGVIILKISGAGGYTISLDPAYFTTELNGSDDIDTVTGKKNFISWFYDGTFLYYTNTKEA